MGEGFLPLQEQHVWGYLRHLQDSGAAPTKATSFLQAVRFCHYVLQLKGADTCMTSRRLQGSAELQLALKGPTRQARPLTVDEVKRLHRVTMDDSVDLQTKVLACHLLLMVYSRSRTSDLAHVEEISHDVSSKSASSGGPGFIQISTRYHKAARGVEKKNLLLPILASATSVLEDDWLSRWLRVRKAAGLPIAGHIDAALQPAPDLKRQGHWLVRPISCSEVTLILRGVLKCEERALSAHSLRTTALSWAAKCEIPREQRRLLGRHSSSLKEADSIYARDLAIAPVKALERVIALIRDGVFTPDQSRADYFQSGNPLAPGTPAPMFQPGTPAFLAEGMPKPAGEVSESQPSFDISEDSGWQKVQWKGEPETLDAISPQGVSEIELVSDSSSQTSSSNEDDAESECEKQDEVSETEAPPDPQVAVQDAFVRNDKSKIIHRIPGIGSETSASVYVNSELIQAKTTKCGRLTSAGFTVVQSIPDWTAKCRICFKGCRAPH